MNHVQSFIKANATAYAKAAAVFKEIEAPDFLTQLAEAGITGGDIKVYATIYVAETTKSGVKPHPSQRGGELVFKKDSVEYNRVKYIVDVATGVRETRAAKKAKATSHRISSVHREAAMSFLGEFEGKDLGEQIKAAIAVLNAMK